MVSCKHTSSLPVIWSSFSAAFLSLELRQASTQSCARCLQGLTACSIRCKATGSRTDVLLQSINSFRSHRQATRDRHEGALEDYDRALQPVSSCQISHDLRILMYDCAKLRCWAYGQATLMLSGALRSRHFQLRPSRTLRWRDAVSHQLALTSAARARADASGYVGDCCQITSLAGESSH